MSRTVMLALAAGLMIELAAPAQETFVGIWEVAIEVPGAETEPTVWTVTERGGEYAVAIEGEIAFDGMRFTTTSTFPREGTDAFVVVNSGVIDGDTFKGTSKFGHLGEYRMTGTRRSQSRRPRRTAGVAL